MANAGNGQNSGFPSSLAAAIALLVAALAAIGLTGAALLRAVRNDPHEISTALTWALIGGGIIAGAQFLPSSDSASTDATKSVTTFTKSPLKVVHRGRPSRKGLLQKLLTSVHPAQKAGPSLAGFAASSRSWASSSWCSP